MGLGRTGEVWGTSIVEVLRPGDLSEMEKRRILSAGELEVPSVIKLRISI